MKSVKVKDIFDLYQGNSFELMHLKISINSNVNFVSRTAQNNGVVAQVDIINKVAPFPAGLITVALGGSVLSAFVQNKPFYTAFHIMVLAPKQEMSLVEKLYYCMCIKANAYKYNYGRQANKTLKDIKLPDTIPQWVYNANIKPISTETKQNTITIDTAQWGYFKIGNLFKLENCKCNVARDLSDGNDCFYIGAKKENNGVMRRVAYNKGLITKGNCIIFICDGQGSVGYSNYIDKDFIGSTTLIAGYNTHINKYTGMFLVTILDLERPKYSFGRKYRTKLANTTIKLPQTPDGSPDWAYMEKYIKSLPYSDRI